MLPVRERHDQVPDGAVLAQVTSSKYTVAVEFVAYCNDQLQTEPLKLDCCSFALIKLFGGPSKT